MISKLRVLFFRFKQANPYLSRLFISVLLLSLALAACAPKDKKSNTKRVRSGSQTFSTQGKNPENDTNSKKDAPATSPDTQAQSKDGTPTAAKSKVIIPETCRITNVASEVDKIQNEQQKDVKFCQSFEPKTDANNKGVILMSPLHGYEDFGPYDLQSSTIENPGPVNGKVSVVADFSSREQPDDDNLIFMAFKLAHNKIQIEESSLKVVRVNANGSETELSKDMISKLSVDKEGIAILQLLDVPSATGNAIDYRIRIKYDLK